MCSVFSDILSSLKTFWKMFQSPNYPKAMLGYSEKISISTELKQYLFNVQKISVLSTFDMH